MYERCKEWPDVRLSHLSTDPRFNSAFAADVRPFVTMNQVLCNSLPAAEEAQAVLVSKLTPLNQCGESFARRKWRNLSPTLSQCPKAGGTGETTSANLSAKAVRAKVKIGF